MKGHRKAIFERSRQGGETPSTTVRNSAQARVIAGPAIIEEVTTTIVIEPGWTAKLHASGSYVIKREVRRVGEGDPRPARRRNMRSGGTMKPKENRSMTQ